MVVVVVAAVDGSSSSSSSRGSTRRGVGLTSIQCGRPTCETTHSDSGGSVGPSTTNTGGTPNNRGSSRVGSGRVGNLMGRVGSGQEVFT